MSRIGLDVTYCFTVRQCQLVDFNLLGFTSVPDPNMNICVMDQGRCDQLALYSWPRRRARRALPVKAYRRHPAWRAVTGVGRGELFMHRSRRAAATGRRVAPPPTLPWRAAATAQFVRSFSSIWSADKPQCRG